MGSAEGLVMPFRPHPAILSPCLVRDISIAQPNLRIQHGLHRNGSDRGAAFCKEPSQSARLRFGCPFVTANVQPKPRCIPRSSFRLPGYAKSKSIHAYGNPSTNTQLHGLASPWQTTSLLPRRPEFFVAGWLEIVHEVIEIGQVGLRPHSAAVVVYAVTPPRVVRSFRAHFVTPEPNPEQDVQCRPYRDRLSRSVARRESGNGQAGVAMNEARYCRHRRQRFKLTQDIESRSSEVGLIEVALVD
jgi:hypothetical protein